MDRFFAQLRTWSEAHPHAGPVVRNAEELRRLAAGESALALKDKPLLRHRLGAISRGDARLVKAAWSQHAQLRFNV